MTMYMYQITMCDCAGRRVGLAEHTISVSGRVEKESPSSLPSHAYAYALAHTRDEVRERGSVCAFCSFISFL